VHAIDLDRGRFLVVLTSGQLALVDAATGKLRKLAAPRQPPLDEDDAIGLSPDENIRLDGDQIVLLRARTGPGGRSQLRVYDLRGGRARSGSSLTSPRRVRPSASKTSTAGSPPT
jgi:hypothetical protein